MSSLTTKVFFFKQNRHSYLVCVLAHCARNIATKRLSNTAKKLVFTVVFPLIKWSPLNKLRSRSAVAS